MASTPCTHAISNHSPVSSQLPNVRIFPRAICNACRAGGACLLLCADPGPGCCHASIADPAEMLGALGLASQSSPFFSAAFLPRVGFRGLSSTQDSRICSCGPFLPCRLPFRPGSALLPRSETVAPSQPPRPVLRSLISLHSPCSNACQARLESMKQPLVIVD
jgi:hypothetical protein